MTIEDKTKCFKQEIEYSKLNDEQKRIYNAFVYKRSKPYHFSVTDFYGNTVRFILYTNKKDDGVLHILSRHYKGNIGTVTAKEIVNICNVIRCGVMISNGKNISYTLKIGDSILKLIVGLKNNKSGNNILKSFYSNRKNS